jgi:SAM-dependent methyltransferase
MSTPSQIVHRIEPDMDRREVACTTYQMRNPFRQFADGVASELDAHCYFQHAYAADLACTNARVLDVCCGRGLLIPFLRYRGNAPSLYCGVDIEPKNARWKDGADPRRESEIKDWGFPLIFVESNVESMTEKVRAAVKENVHSKETRQPFDLIVYTSAIEHMQPAAQRASLIECATLAHEKTVLYLTCPVTSETEDGYNAQYAAHVYEPKESELRDWLKAAGWRIVRRIGLSTGVKHLRATLKGRALEGAEYLLKIMPREQALPAIAALYPDCALEIAYVCQKNGSAKG